MSEHTVPLALYYRVFGALLVLTAVTVAVAFADFGALNDVVALTIAVAKATLVVLYFMHVRWSGKLVWVFACAGFLWLVILLAMTFGDFVSRDWIPEPGL